MLNGHLLIANAFVIWSLLLVTSSSLYLKKRRQKLIHHRNKKSCTLILIFLNKYPNDSFSVWLMILNYSIEPFHTIVSHQYITRFISCLQREDAEAQRTWTVQCVWRPSRLPPRLFDTGTRARWRNRQPSLRRGEKPTVIGQSLHPVNAILVFLYRTCKRDQFQLHEQNNIMHIQ